MSLSLLPPLLSWIISPISNQNGKLGWEMRQIIYHLIYYLIDEPSQFSGWKVEVRWEMWDGRLIDDIISSLISGQWRRSSFHPSLPTSQVISSTISSTISFTIIIELRMERWCLSPSHLSHHLMKNICGKSESLFDDQWSISVSQLTMSWSYFDRAYWIPLPFSPDMGEMRWWMVDYHISHN